MDRELIRTRDKAGKFDGLVTAKPGEPTFTLQGGDPFAPAVITCWVDLARNAARREENEEKADRLLKRASAAESVAWVMEAYQRGEVFEKAEKAASAAVVLQSDDVIVLVAAARRIDNAIAELADVQAALAEAGLADDGCHLLGKAGIELRAAAKAIDPRAEMERK